MPGALCLGRDKGNSSCWTHKTLKCSWSLCHHALTDMVTRAARDTEKQNVSKQPNLCRLRSWTGARKGIFQKLTSLCLKNQTKKQFPRSQTYPKALTPNSCSTRDVFYQLLHLQFCPTALLHPGKTEQATQEQTINCDLFYSIHLIHNRLYIPVRLSGKLFGLVCTYQGLPII